MIARMLVPGQRNCADVSPQEYLKKEDLVTSVIDRMLVPGQRNCAEVSSKSTCERKSSSVPYLLGCWNQARETVPMCPPRVPEEGRLGYTQLGC